MTSIGTLFAFVIVCGGILVMRKTHPDAAAAVPNAAGSAGADFGRLVCLAMMDSLGWTTGCGWWSGW